MDRDARLTEPPEGARATRRARPGRWLLSCVGFLAVAAAATYFLAVEGAKRRLREHRESLPKQWAALPLMPGRPAVLEPAESGEAREVLGQLFAAVDAVPEADRDALSTGVDAGPPEGDDAILDRHPEPLRILLRLPHVPAAPLSASPGVTGIPPWLESLRWTEAACERALRSKDSASALGIALASLVVDADMARDGSIISWLAGAGSEADWSERMGRALSLDWPSPDVSRSCRLALEALDRARAPVTFGPRIQQLLEIEFMTRDMARPLPDFEEQGWRYLWNADVYAAAKLHEELEELTRLERRLQSIDLDAPTAPSLLPAETPDPTRTFALWSRAAERRLTARAWNAVLRAALAFLERGPGTTVEESALSVDPWSEKPVRFDGSRVWSIGPDRTDDGGDAEKDLVVTLPR